MTKIGNPSYKTTNAVLIILGAAFFAIDRYLKWLAENYQLPGLHIGQWLSLEISKNENIAFSLPVQGRWLEMLIALIIIALTAMAIWQAFFQKNRASTKLTGLILIMVFGALSNLIDRFRFGYVIDYIYLKNLISLNLADVLISLAAATMIIAILMSKKPLNR